MPEQLSKIESKIITVKKELMRIGPMRPGALSKQYQNPKSKKGGFYQLSYTHHMKSKTEYVRKENVKEIQNQIAEYKRFKKLTQEWIDLSIECSRIKSDINK